MEITRKNLNRLGLKLVILIMGFIGVDYLSRHLTAYKLWYMPDGRFLYDPFAGWVIALWILYAISILILMRWKTHDHA
jgi:hypothetical protein